MSQLKGWRRTELALISHCGSLFGGGGGGGGEGNLANSIEHGLLRSL